MPSDYSEIFNKACDYLSQREHSEYELRGKLRRKFAEASLSDIDVIIEKLKSLGFQSDERFIESFIRTKFYSKNGPMKIQYELGRKGIRDKLSFDGLDFYSTALSFAKVRYAGQLEKYEKLSGKEKLKLKEKIYRGLSGRGFGYETVKKVMSDLMN